MLGIGGYSLGRARRSPLTLFLFDDSDAVSAGYDRQYRTMHEQYLWAVARRKSFAQSESVLLGRNLSQVKHIFQPSVKVFI